MPRLAPPPGNVPFEEIIGGVELVGTFEFIGGSPRRLGLPITPTWRPLGIAGVWEMVEFEILKRWE